MMNFDLRDSRRSWWRTGAATLGIVVIAVAAFCLVHCVDEHGGMSPEQCAKTMVTVSMAALAVLSVVGLITPPFAPPVVLVWARRFERPPKSLAC